MLNAIKKKFFNAPSGEKDQEQMKQDNPQPTLAAPEMAKQLEAVHAQLSAQFEELKATTELLEEMSANFNSVKVALDAAVAEKAELVAQAAATRLSTRTKAVVEAVGTEKAPALLAATESLGDEQFNAIVGAMVMNLDAEAKSPMFQEKGAAAESAPVDVDPVAKLADKLAKEFKHI